MKGFHKFPFAMKEIGIGSLEIGWGQMKQPVGINLVVDSMCNLTIQGFLCIIISFSSLI